MDELLEHKKALRDTMLEKRASIPLKQAKKAAYHIADSFMGNVPRQKWDVIGGYWPMAGEVDTILLLEALAEQGHHIALPCVTAKDTPLTFRRWNKGLELTRNATYKTQEPPAAMPALTPTLLIVPLLAFDSAGYRLGYGGGFYDRTLAALAHNQTLFTVGFAYARQQVGSVPHAAHDVPLDCIITEERLLLTASSDSV